MSHSIGDNVYALFEGTAKYFPAEVVSGPSRRGYYEVKFSNGQVDLLKSAQIKKESAMQATKSPSRRRSSSRSRSRSRGRSPGRPKSPSRSKAADKSPTRTKAEKSPKEPKETTPTRTSRRTTRTVEEAKQPNHNEAPTRHSSRIANMQNEKAKENNTESERLETKTRTNKTKVGGLSGPLGALICALTTPVFTMLLLRHCSKKDCTFLKWPSVPKSFSALWDRQTALVFACISCYMFMLSSVPLGRVVQGTTLRNGRKLLYRCGGFLQLLVTGALWCVLAFYLKWPVTFHYDHTNHFIFLNALFCFVASSLFYVKARYANNANLNPNGNSGNIIYDWFMGHELNPRLGSLDVKFLITGRFPLIALVLYDASILAKACTTTHAAPSNTLLLVTAMHLLYAVDGLWFEEELLYRWDMRHEGLGHLTMQTFGHVRPILWTMASRFVFQQNVKLSNWTLTAIFFVFAAGYVIFRGSSSQKFHFRKNPYDPSLSHLESIPTGSGGKRLLSSGWWGLVRHPNYLGELVMGLAWCLACGFTHLYPYVYVFYLLGVLVARALRDDRHMKKVYGGAWANYANAVPHRIFPKIW